MAIAKAWLQWICVSCLVLPISTFAWNAVGHRIIAQIAYDQLTPRTIRMLNQYNRAVNQVYPTQNWMSAAVWLDTVRHQHIETYNAMHFIDLYFSEDGSPLPASSRINARTAIEQAILTLQQHQATDYQKGIAFRILLHVVGDIHQPLHATTRVSQQYPEGDKGGNLVELSKNPVAKNLHAYWDNGAGYLKCQPQHKRKRRKNRNTMTIFGLTSTWNRSIPQSHSKSCNIKQMARQLEQEYPCRTLPTTTQPSLWADESHELGVRAYQWLYEHNPDDAYQTESIKVVKKRVALAGCRLGALLNRVSKP